MSGSSRPPRSSALHSAGTSSTASAARGADLDVAAALAQARQRAPHLDFLLFLSETGAGDAYPIGAGRVESTHRLAAIGGIGRQHREQARDLAIQRRIGQQRRQLVGDGSVAEARAIEDALHARVAPRRLEARLLDHPGVEARAQRRGERLVDAVLALGGVGGEIEGAAGVGGQDRR